MVVGSATISNVCVPDLDEIQLRLHGVDLNRWSSSDIIVIKAALIHKDRFPIPYSYELRSSSMEEVSETLGYVFKYGIFVWDSRAMKVIEDKNNESSSNNTSEKE